MAPDDRAALRARLDALVGEPVGSAGADDRARPGQPADDPALGRRLRGRQPRVHRPGGGGRRRAFGEIVAPPVMLQTWTFPTPMITGMAERGGSPVESTGAEPARRARRGRASSPRWRRTPSSRSSATSASARPCRAQTVMESISEEKQTRHRPRATSSPGSRPTPSATARSSAASGSASSSSSRGAAE